MKINKFFSKGAIVVICFFLCLINITSAINNPSGIEIVNIDDEEINIENDLSVISFQNDLFYVVVAHDIYNNPGENVQAAVAQYKEDIETYIGVDVEIIVWDDLENGLEHITPLRNLLYDAYLNDNLIGVLLIGNIPWLAGIGYHWHPGGYYPSMFMDYIYMDLDGDVYDTDGDTRIVEIHEGSISPEIFASRLRPSNITRGNLSKDIEYINNYFEKDHAYHTNDTSHNITTIERRGVLWVAPAGSTGPVKSNLGYIYPQEDILEFYGNETTLANFSILINRSRDSPGVEMMQICAHGASKFADGHFVYRDVKKYDPKVLFLELHGCSSSNYYSWLAVGNWYIFTTNYSLSQIGGTTYGGFSCNDYLYAPLRQGYCIGEAYRELCIYNPIGSMGTYSNGAVLFGDPFIYFPNETFFESGYSIPSAPPVPTGGPDLGSGTIQLMYTYIFGPAEQDNITFDVDWGDGTLDRSEPVETGEYVSFDHCYDVQKTYNIRVRAVDELYVLSNWSQPLSVLMGMPEINVDPLMLYSEAEEVSYTPQQLTITNTGNTQLHCNEITHTYFGPASSFGTQNGKTISSTVTKDEQDNLHLIWLEQTYNTTNATLYYQKWKHDIQIWEEPIIVETLIKLPLVPRCNIEIDSNYNLHILWNSDNESSVNIHYKKWDYPLQQWNETKTIIDDAITGYFTTSISNSDVVQIMNLDYFDGYTVSYTNSDIWDTQIPETMWENITLASAPKLIYDTEDNLHLVIEIWNNTLSTICHRIRNSTTESWNDIQPIFNPNFMQYSFYNINMDGEGNLHLIYKGTNFTEELPLGLYHKKWDKETQIWTSDNDVVRLNNVNYTHNKLIPKISFSFDQNNILHVIWEDANKYNIYTPNEPAYYYQSWDTNLQPNIQPQLVADQHNNNFPVDNGVNTEFILSNDGDIHLIWFNWDTNTSYHQQTHPYIIDWITVEPSSFTVDPSDSYTFNVIHNTTALETTIYSSYILIHNNDLYNLSNLIQTTIDVYPAVPPAPPEGLITITNTTYTDLMWPRATVNSIGKPQHDIKEYRLYRNTTEEDFEFLDSVNQTTTKYQDTTITPGNTYIYRITVYDLDDYESTYTQSHELVPGDANGDSAVDIDDVVYLISYIFSGGPEPPSLAAGDANGSCTIDIDDVVYLISYIFSGGPPPFLC